MPEAVPGVMLALGDPTRLAIVRLLGREPLRSGDLATQLGVSRPAMSRHLRALREAGLVADAVLDDDGRGRVYRLQREPFDELRGWLDEVESFWAGQLAAFKAHAEARADEGAP